MISVRVLRVSIGVLIVMAGLIYLASLIGGLNDVWVIQYTTLDAVEHEFTLVRVDLARDLRVSVPHIPAPVHNDTTISFSSDAHYALVASGTTVDNALVSVVDLHANTTTELGGGYQLLSPDARHFVYGFIGLDVVLVDVRQPDTPLISLSSQFITGMWSVDGRYFIYGELVEEDVMLMMVDTHDDYRIQPLQADDLGFMLASSWSPDGRIVVVTDGTPFDSQNDIIPQHQHVYAIELDMERADNLPTTIIADAIPNASSFTEWSGDSRYLFSTFLSFIGEETNAQIYDFETGEACEFIISSELTSGLYSLAWSPIDEDWVMVTSAGGFYRINPTTCERTVPVIVPTHVEGVGTVVWSADYSQFVAQTFNGWVQADINGNIIREFSGDGTVQLR